MHLFDHIMQTVYGLGTLAFFFLGIPRLGQFVGPIMFKNADFSYLDHLGMGLMAITILVVVLTLAWFVGIPLRILIKGS